MQGPFAGHCTTTPELPDIDLSAFGLLFREFCTTTPTHTPIPRRHCLVSQVLFDEAQRREWQAILCTESKQEAFRLMGDLGEVLRGSGDRGDAEKVLKSTLREENLPIDVRGNRLSVPVRGGRITTPFAFVHFGLVLIGSVTVVLCRIVPLLLSHNSRQLFAQWG